VHVLVTGATGRIGLPLVAALRDTGHEVRALTLPGDPRSPALQGVANEVLAGDVADRATCSAALDGIDAVFHLAGLLPQNAADSQIFEVNVRGTWELVGAAAERADQLRIFVFASTNDVYSVQDALYSPVDETHPRHPVSTYGLSKVIGEEVCLYYHRRHDLRSAIARFGLTQRADELLTGLTAQYFLLSAHVDALAKRAAAEPSVIDELRRLQPLLEEHGEAAIVLRDRQGAPWQYQLCEVTDIVGGLLLFLLKPAAIGEAINLSAPAPFASDVAAEYLASRTGLPIVDVVAPPGLHFSESTSKARSLLGYEPRMAITDILDRALHIVGADTIAARRRSVGAGRT